MGRRGLAAHGVRWLALACCLTALPAAAETPARKLFGAKDRPAALPSAAIGGYAKGCLSGGVRLEDFGDGFQTMRPSRNRAWGHPRLIAVVRDLARNLRHEGYAPILIGDMAQARGGPMLTGHRSHQIGLDADIWFRPGPRGQLSREEREEWSAKSVVHGRTAPWVNERFTSREARMVELAARSPEVARIFVNAPIKKALCEAYRGGDRSWLRKVRPWYGHIYHMHVRLHCPTGMAACKNQKPPPPGAGCGDELAGWLKPPKPVKPKPGQKPKPVKKREIYLSQLPRDCRSVLAAPDG